MKIELSSLVENQLPLYVREEYPLAAEFLKQYYLSENANKIVQNIDQYLDLDVIFDIPEYTILINSIDFDDDTINVSSTKGFPETYGLLKIDDEIITYTSKSETTFEGCVRGFSGVERNKSTQLVFNSTSAKFHNAETKVYNLSSFFLKEFLFKTKQKIAPGFENRTLSSSINEANFIKRLKDFYQSKGTAEAFRLLFGALYGADVKVILPRDRLFSASNAQYRVTKKLVAEALEGNPKDLVNGTIYQDSDGFIAEARGTITYVEEIIRNNKPYYVISLDFDYDKDIDVSGSLLSEFTVHPQTIITSTVTANSSFIDVDSTVGFPDSGTLIINQNITITYSKKNLNQFLDCSSITQTIVDGTPIRLNVFAYGFTSNQEQVKLRITGVLDEPEFIDNNSSYNPKEEFEIETLGFPSESLKANNWNFNIPLTYILSSIELVDTSDLSYRIKTIDNCVLFVGDKCNLISPNNSKIPGIVSNVLNNNTVIISFDSLLDLNVSYTLKKELTKTSFQGAPELDIYNANVQNTFLDSDKNVYVLASSLPSYLNADLTTNVGKITFSGTFVNQVNLTLPHPFFTGDSVVYRPASSTNKLFNEGIYFIKKIDNLTIKFALSRENLYNETYVNFSATVTDSTLEFFEFTGNNLQSKTIQPQNLIRKLVVPTVSEQRIETPLSAVGILKNGVEILNYKSHNQIFYGPITKIVAAAPGRDYDVINPPILNVLDQVGTGATVYPAVTGNLKRIDLVYSGFDYLDEPTIKIKGGNGINAAAKANLIEFTHVEFFNADSGVNLATDTIGFTTYHKFRKGEEVIYNSNNQTQIGGLIPNEKYFVNPINGLNLTIHPSSNDAIVGINTVNLTSKGTGLHILKAVTKKQKVASISVLDSGEGYKYRKNLISGIVTSTGILEVKNHTFSSGELVVYKTDASVSTGLLNNTQYYVKVIDENHLRLAGVNTTDPGDFLYKTDQLIGITSFSTAKQYLSYPPVEVKISGRIGVATFDSSTFNAEIIPIFRGGITDVTIESGGNSYGSEEILDYSVEPNIVVSKGSGAQLKPIITDGKIISVVVQYTGINYSSTPDLIIDGNGFNAVLTPIISNGLLVDVKVISGGFGYDPEKTRIIVVSPGEGVQFRTTINSWRINNFEKFRISNYFSEDDGVIFNALDDNSGLQYYHLFAPRKLRRSSYAKNSVEGTTIFTPDLLLNQNSREVDSILHSPIIGWAYDGNPIYGPYGYGERFNSTSIRQLRSGYTLKTNEKLLEENRPSQAIFPVGLFVEDYEYTNSGDLDEHNGRYCATPEYPNGTYAYFASFESTASNDGIFNNYKKPQFPYLIGNIYYSKPISFNFEADSNQNKINISELGLLRNTTPYNLKTGNTNYSGLLLPFDKKRGVFTINSVNPAKISKIDVISSGDGYKINEIVELDGDNGAKISKINGKTVTNVSIAETSAKNVQILTKNEKIWLYAETYHTVKDKDQVFFSSYDGYNTFQRAIINKNALILSKVLEPSGSTGIVTHINVYGDLSEDAILPNDIYEIGQENIKVLTVDKSDSRIWVQREVNGTSGITTRPVGFAITEKSRKIILDNTIGINTSLFNNQYYFKTTESVGLGTVGINTLYLGTPGVGITYREVPARTIYLENHKLATNTKVVYNKHSNQAISVSINGNSPVFLDTVQNLFAANISENLIGLSTVPVGLSTTGSFVGIGSTASLLTFTSFGTGDYHSFTSAIPTINGDVIKQDIIVSTDSSHSLSLNDKIELSVLSGISTEIKFKYSDFNKRILSKETQIVSVDVTNNILEFTEHQFQQGEKVIYNRTSQTISGLENDGIYYAIVINKFKIKLATNNYNADQKIAVDLLSSGDGKIHSINPSFNLEKNSTIVFDLSDPSLGYVRNNFSYSAFEFDIFTDSKFEFPYYNSGITPQLSVVKSGRIGIDSTAKVVLNIDDNSPQFLYYNFKKLGINIPTEKAEKVTDIEQISHNTLFIAPPRITDSYNVKDYTNNTFTIEPRIQNTAKTYTNQNSLLNYTTNSKTASGGIASIQITKNNSNNYRLPNILRINTESGKGAELEIVKKDIGSIKTININDIGFDYSSDSSVKPKLNLPKIIKSDPLYTIEGIDVVRTPLSYFVRPKLVLIDNATAKPVEDVVLNYSPQNEEVSIIKNTQSIVGTEPYIITTNNPFGVEINNISYNPSTKDVTIVLNQEFNNISEFPFEIGKKILVENVIVGENEKGYNSSVYDYALFTIKNVDPNIGGIGATIGYSLNNYLENNETPGTYNSSFLNGTVVPESFLPVFSVKVKQPEFVIGENVFSDGKYGIVVDQNTSNNYIKVLSKDDLTIGKTLTGQTSKTSIIITDILSFEAYLNVKSSSRVVEGWKRETGFFNNNLQRLHDNDYYQYFSYSLKSDIDYTQWQEAVNDLAHPVGFKMFGDLDVYLETPENPPQSGVDVEVKLFNESVLDLNMNCIDNFDLVRENSFFLDNIFSSNEVYFNSVIIQDYIESINNRVLPIDNFTFNFSQSENVIESAIIDEFNKNQYYYRRYFISIRDKWDLKNSNFTIVNLLHNGSDIDINQYSDLATEESFGYFDGEVFNNTVLLNYFPTTENNAGSYIENVSYSIGFGSVGISSLPLGNIANIQYSNSLNSVGIETTTIIGISSSVRGAKLFVGFAYTNNSHYEVDELNLIHDGNSIKIVNYGELLLGTGTSGIGTYYPYYSGNEIKIDLIPNIVGTGTAFYINTIQNNIFNSSIVGMGSTTIASNVVISTATTTSSGIATEVLNYSNNNSGSYSFVCIENLTNASASALEFVSMRNKDLNITNYTSFGDNDTTQSLGIISSYIKNNSVIVEFRPNTTDYYSVRSITTILSTDHKKDSLSISNSFSIDSNYKIYSVKKSEFDLYHEGQEIFTRTFNGSSVNDVNTSQNTISLPNHFFVTGEEVEYSYEGSPIGIGTTFVVGIGTTSLMPKKVYLVKVNDLEVKVAASASDALAKPERVFDIVSLGVGTEHRITSIEPANRTLITLDNEIQAPLVSTAITSLTTKEIGYFDSEIFINPNIFTNIENGDLLKIDDEIMQVVSVGIGSTNVLMVDRGVIGTNLGIHSLSSVVYKLKGNYSIIGNKLQYIAPETIINDVNYSYEFGGRVFLRSGLSNSQNKTYYDNYIFDDFSSEFDGSKNKFKLQNNGQDVETTEDRNAIVLVNNIFQMPGNNYNITESVGVSTITFVGTATSIANDINTSNLPRGGIIVSAGSTQGFGYQPIVSAGGTAVVSIAGTIQSISIGNSGSGYRSGLQTVRVGIQTSDLDSTTIDYIGIASVSGGNVIGISITNPGIGYTSYPIQYSTKNTNQIAIGSTIITLDEIVGLSTANFISIANIINAPITGVGTTSVTIGTAFTSNNTISLGTTAFIKSFKSPKVIFDEPLAYSNLPLKYVNGTSGLGTEARVSIHVGQGSSIISFEIKNSGYGYKIGDELTIETGGAVGIPTYTSPFIPFKIKIENIFNDSFASWVIGDLQPLDSFDNLFDGKKRNFQLKISNVPISIQKRRGSSLDLAHNLLIFINDILQVPGESYIFEGGSIVRFIEPPSSNDKSKVLFYRGTSNIDTDIVDIVESIKVGDKIIINSDIKDLQQKDRIVTNVPSVEAIETYVYSDAGITEDESLLRPVTVCQQTEDFILNGVVISKNRTFFDPIITPTTKIISTVGIAATQIFVESVRPLFENVDEYIESDTPQRKVRIITQDDNNLKYETITEVKYDGDYGIVVGVNTATIGVGSTGIVFDLFVPLNSPLRNDNYLVNGLSGITTNYYFIINNSNIENGIISLNDNETAIGIGTTFINNIYKAHNVSIAQTSVPGVGITDVVRVTSKVDRFISGIGISSYYGNYSWGRLHQFARSIPKEFIVNPSGISTAAIVQRTKPIKTDNYYI